MCAASFKLSLSQVEKPPTEVELNFIQSFFIFKDIKLGKLNGSNKQFDTNLLEAISECDSQLGCDAHRNYFGPTDLLADHWAYTAYIHTELTALYTMPYWEQHITGKAVSKKQKHS